MKSTVLLIVIIVLGVGVFLLAGNSDKEDILKDDTLKTFTWTEGPINYSIKVPSGWFSYENGSSVIFTKDSNLEIPPNTEGFAIGPNFYVTISNITDIAGVASYDDWLDKNGMTDKNPLFIESKDVNVNGLAMRRVIMEGSGVAGRILTYVYFADIQRVITLSQFPYDQESEISKVFEEAVKTFSVPERQNPSPTSADNAPPGSIHNLPVPDAVAAVRTRIAGDLGISEGLVIIMTAYEKDWSDGCLGLGGPAEACLAVITPGYEVTASAAGEDFTYRTNADGTVLRREK